MVVAEAVLACALLKLGNAMPIVVASDMPSTIFLLFCKNCPRE
jgi:hypothetical protein